MLWLYDCIYGIVFINIPCFSLPNTSWLTYETIYLSWQDTTLVLDQKRWKKILEKKQQKA